MGLPLTLFSMYGIVALTGIVVNDSIVLIDFINARVRNGMPINQAIREAGTRRFRPVLLTTVTTIGGLTPILLETSLQAQILIPMATSIAFGEFFATVLVLYLVPVSYSLYFSLLPNTTDGVLQADEHPAGEAGGSRRVALLGLLHHGRTDTLHFGFLILQSSFIGSAAGRGMRSKRATVKQAAERRRLRDDGVMAERLPWRLPTISVEHLALVRVGAFRDRNQPGMGSACCDLGKPPTEILVSRSASEIASPGAVQRTPFGGNPSARLRVPLGQTRREKFDIEHELHITSCN